MMNQSLPQMINNVQFQSQQQMMMNWVHLLYRRRSFKMMNPELRMNTTSFLIRAKKSGIAELVSPYPVTPAVLPTPMFSSTVLVIWLRKRGVDGQGSMKGLIRLRSPGREDVRG
ncbi:hypothetical protein Leryth_026792 [Lithospermum erythrorhizon]|nr:hypothetical protein Leryth_026792 [Lithospermum erythrorhizon]